MLRSITAVTLFNLALCLPAHAAVPVSGLWLTTEKDSIVEIGSCGATVCGKIMRILRPDPKSTGKDSNNPDPALRLRPILGLPILTGFKDAGKNWAGTVYDPRVGKTYRSTLTLMKDGTLEVKGCIGPFCRTKSWTRTR